MESSGPIQVGVTGGIGSGKSLICRIFRCLDVPVYEADLRARWLTNHDLGIRRDIIDLLGSESFTIHGDYNRTYVASRVFSDSGLLQQLNKIIHPKVFEDTDRWLSQNWEHPYVIKEAAIMNKAGDGNTLDFVIVVTAPVSLRLARIKARDQWRSEEEIMAIIKQQKSEEERLAMADFVISNDLNVPLIPQVLELHNKLLIHRR